MQRITRRWGAALVLAVLMLTAAGVLADDDFQIPLDRDGLPAWAIKQWTDFPVRLVLPDQQALQTLLDKVPLASFDRAQIAPRFSAGKVQDLVFEPRVTEAEFAALQLAGYRPEKLRDLERENREESERVWRAMAQGKAEDLRSYPLDYVPTNDQIGAMLQDIAAAHPTLAGYYTWGASVQGRTLHALVITQDVGTSAAKPQVRYSSTIHGDEITGLVLCLNLAQYLVDKYGQAGFEDVTDLVDNYELHLLPLHNPDGMYLGQRTNANAVDLNRNFLEPAGTHPSLQTENVAFVNHAQARRFVISINYHGGALVMNYPWDYTYTLAADNDAIVELCLEYSTRNLPMYNGSFPQGITNGAEWYVITGSLQDWSYDQTECIDITCEVSTTKWPSGSALPGYWSDNRDAMVAFARSARAGITGTVTDAATGQPLAAVITIAGNAKPVTTNPLHGDYYKLVEDGTFTVTAQADGYVTKTVAGVAATWGVENVVDFALLPMGTGVIAGTVKNPQGQGMDATVAITTWPAGEPVTTIDTHADQGGVFTAELDYGDYTLTASAPGLLPVSEQATVGLEPAAVDLVLGGWLLHELAAADFEAGAGIFSGDWVVIAPGHQSDQCLKSSAGSYPANATLLAAMSGGVSLVDVLEPEVGFYAKWTIESSWDAVFFEISTDGGTAWTALAVPGCTRAASGQGRQTPAGTPCFDGTQSDWILGSVDLAAYIGQPDVRLRFRLASDGSVQRDGFYVDDFVLSAVTEADPSAVVEPVPAAVASLAAQPNPFNPTTCIRLGLPRAGAATVAVYDLQGRRVRSLLSGELAAGEHRATWDGTTDAGRPAGSGVYLVRLTADGQRASVKVTLVK